MIIGYARVSMDGQTLDAQQATLAAAGAGRVFAEKVSGTVTDRKALAKAITALQAGDVLLVTPARPSREVYSGPSERACNDLRERRGISIDRRCMGRYD